MTRPATLNRAASRLARMVEAALFVALCGAAAYAAGERLAVGPPRPDGAASACGAAPDSGAQAPPQIRAMRRGNRSAARS